MERNIVASLMPLTVLCVICGLSLPTSRQSKLRTVYGLAVTTVCCILWTVYLIVKLATVDFNYLINVMKASITTLTSIMIIYYQIKCNFRHDQISNCIANIVYVDQSLQSLYVEVPHKQNTVVCILFIIGAIIFCVHFTFETLYYIDFSSLILDVKRLYKLVCFLNLYMFITVQFIYCFYLIIIIRQRVRLIRRAVEAFHKLSDRNVAWSDSVTVAVVVQPRSCLLYTSTLFDVYFLL